MNLLPDVAEMVGTLVAGVQQQLGENLVGIYLRGSLALGDFIPETSDIDLLVVTERPVDEAEFAALARLHEQLAAQSNPYAKRIEIAYLDRAALKRFRPGLRHPTLGQGEGESLVWTEHRINWLLERWALYERGIPLLGPDPRSLVDQVAPEELAPAVRIRLQDWAEWASDEDDPEWLWPRSHKAYVVETMCRALYTLVCGAVVSKPQAVAWALQTLPEPWRSTVARSQAWRRDDTIDLAIIPEVRQFVLWVAAYEPGQPLGDCHPASAAE